MYSSCWKHGSVTTCLPPSRRVSHRSDTAHDISPGLVGGAAVYRSSTGAVYSSPWSRWHPQHRPSSGFGFKIVSAASVWYVSGVYRPPPAPNSLFFDEFCDFSAESQTSPGWQLFCGHFNCPGNTDDSIDGRLMVLVESFNMPMCANGSTGVAPDGSAGNLLDLLFHNAEPGVVTNFSGVNTGVTDHLLPAASLKFPPTKVNVSTFRGRNLKKLDYVRLQDELLRCSFTTNPLDDVDSFVDQLSEDVTAVLDRLAPIRTTKKRISKRRSPDLLGAARKAKQHRRACERRYRKSGSDDDRKRHCDATRAANRSIIDSSRAHSTARLIDAAGDQKSIWNIANELLHRNNGVNSDSVDPGEKTNLCTSFKNFFIGKLCRIRSDISTRLSALRGALINIPLFNTSRLHQFQPVSAHEVLRIIASKKCKTSPLDSIPTVVLKKCADVFSPSLAHLANLSFAAGVFPSDFNLGHVVLLLKKPGSDKHDPSNYRPITNLVTISKILERLVLARLQPHIHSSRNFSPFQSAYRRGHSTETALLRVVNDLNVSMESGSCSVLISLDISAAFDTIDIDLLLQRL